MDQGLFRALLGALEILGVYNERYENGETDHKKVPN